MGSKLCPRSFSGSPTPFLQRSNKKIKTAFKILSDPIQWRKKKRKKSSPFDRVVRHCTWKVWSKMKGNRNCIACVLMLWVAASIVRYIQLSPRVPQILPVFKEQSCSYHSEHWTRGRFATVDEATDLRAKHILDSLGQGVTRHRKQ